jgi:Peptidase family M28
MAVMDLLRSVIEELAPIPRLPTSDGERDAAHLIRDRLEGYGCRAAVEEVSAYRSYAWPIGVLSALGFASAVASLRGHRVLGAIGGAVAAIGIVDDITGGAMATRRVAMRPRTAYNVVAETGDPESTRTLVVLAHHDAAPSGLVFDQTVTQWLADRRPDIVEALKSNPPLWWPVIAGPAFVSLGSVAGSRRLRWLGLISSLGSLAAMVDIGRRPAVPGANDNLSGVAALVSVAEQLARDPVSNLRVLLVSAGAEEALQEGIRGFARAHFPRLRARDTWFLNLDTVGSGRLVLLEGEGTVRMHDYDRAFKDLVARCAAEHDIPLLRGLRSHNSTDGSVPHRHGYPTATVVSVDDRKLLPHYHLDSDRPEHVDYECVGRAARLAGAVTRALATG